ncbi:hypothetical protein TVAG_077060 [Trichomonas vaginalis G3]|uniref:Golgi apparatus membrane protein TVP23 homolog n=1 Tax=Trichomonas vaginalis (strain ATCC PRA-98 / G3) TaxID=412133 RepID=A2D9V3_TRIV3|nr:Golgi APPARATUS membrane protein TVP23 family [Trichomonas vaginalis G3]EAY22959.1 hypothetical protein TVAG_077060 [Trichomonas vaginalis G3]KAI5527289.1 Golgi APPARATUS membrane protein TVP23 family [Trichomonas vaginalis G3]|eukprot:XP_001583945.1 hypothetical protein [Trichomonas vaginalis G3]
MSGSGNIHHENDQEDLIKDEFKENTANSSSWFSLIKISLVFSSIWGLFFCKINYISLTLELLDFILCKQSFGKYLVGIKWSLNCGGDSMLKFDITAEDDMPSPSYSNIFWIGNSLVLILWILVVILSSIFQRWIYSSINALILILQLTNISIFLKGNSIAAKQSAEQVRSVLLGNVEAFEELPEQATLQSVSKSEETKSQEIKENTPEKSNDTQTDNTTAKDTEKPE